MFEEEKRKHTLNGTIFLQGMFLQKLRNEITQKYFARHEYAYFL